MSVSTGHDECLGSDRFEAAAQEGSQRCGVARRDLREHDVPTRDQPQRFRDQTAPGTACVPSDDLDRHLQSADQPAADRDQTGAVSVHVHVAAVSARSHDTGVIVEVIALG